MSWSSEGGPPPSCCSAPPLLAGLVARGHKVTAMAADATPEIADRLAALGVDLEPVGLVRSSTNPLGDARTLAELARHFRRLRPDVVFAYTIKPVIYGSLAARLAGVPRRYAMVTGLGYAFGGQDRLRRRALRRLAAGLYRAALAGVDGLFVQNLDDRADLAAAGALPRALPVTVVRGSGVDVDHYAPAAMPPGPPRFLYVGRLLREKGILEFVELARRVRARHPAARFQVAGWIDPNPEAIDRATVDGWVADGTIEYLGELADVRPALAAAHVLVLPSYREGTPRSVLEAMSTARPVIVTDVPGSRDTIVDGEHGFVVAPRDPDALAAAAERLISDPALAAAMGARGRARACALYDARAVAATMIDAMGL